MFKITYTKHFTEGSLKGLVFDAMVSFPSKASAKGWMDAMKCTSTATSKYKNFPFTTSNFQMVEAS